MNAYKEMRYKYKPRNVKVLFIGESPPKPKDSELRYFYNEKTNRRGSLYWRMANALGLDKNKEKGLEKFKTNDMWLTDIFDEPLDDVNETKIDGHLERLLDEIREVKPEKIVLLLPDRECCRKKKEKGKKKHFRNQIVRFFLKQMFPDIDIYLVNPWKDGFTKELKKIIL